MNARMNLNFVSILAMFLGAASPLSQSSATNSSRGQNTTSERIDVEAIASDCSNNKLDRCFDLAMLYKHGVAVESNDGKSKELLKKSCDGHYELACVSLAQMTNDLKLLEESCKRKFGPACFELAVETGANSADADKKWSELACQYDYGPGCTHLGQISEETPVEPNSAASVEYYKKGCELKDGAGCYLLGRLISKIGGENAKSLSDEAYKRACSFHFPAPPCERRETPHN
jgi:TPR repeat protein